MASFKELIETYGKQVDLSITHGDMVWESDNIVSCRIGADASLLMSVMKQAEIELESAAFGDNVSGWSDKGLLLRGKNMANPILLQNAGGVLQEDGSLCFSNASLLNRLILWDAPPLFSGSVSVSAMVRYKNDSGLVGSKIGVYYKDGTREWWDCHPSSNDTSHTDYREYTLVSNPEKEVDYVTATYGTGTNSTWIKDLQIEVGAEITEYEPYYETVYPLEKTELAITLIVKAEDESASKDFDTFIIKEASYNDENNAVNLLCYDMMLRAMIPYVPVCEISKETPVTVLEFLQAICSYLGIELATTEFYNADALIDEEKYDSQYTFRDVLTEIAQAAGGTIAIKGNKLHVLYPSESGHTIDPSNLSSIEVGEKYGPINSVVLARTPQEDNVYVRADEIERSGKGTVTVENAVSGPLRSLVLEYLPTMSAGIPSFENILQVNPVAVAGVSIENEGDTVYAGDIVFGDEYNGMLYGGSYDWITGIFTENWRLFTFDGSESWAILGGETDELLPIGLQGDLFGIKRVNTALCDRLQRADADGTEGTFRVDAKSTYNLRFMVPKTIAADRAAWIAYLQTTPLQVIAEVAEPVQISFTPAEPPELLAGDNIINSDASNLYVQAVGEFQLTGEIKIENNQLMDADRDAFLSGLRSALFGFEFYPYSITSFGLGYLEVCDLFTLQTLDGRKYKTICLSMETEIGQGLTDSLSATAPASSETDYKAASPMEKMLNQTILRVNKQEGTIASLVSRQGASEDTLEELSTQVKQDAERVEIAINKEVDHVRTSTGFSFDQDGLCVKKSGSEMSTTIDEDGMNVDRGDEPVLTADSGGVNAENLTARQYLVAGTYSRLEDYSDGTDDQRTGCYFLK